MSTATPSAQIRSIVADAMSESGMGQRRLEAARSLPAWSLRGIMDPSREQSPSVDRAAEILAALGYELTIRPVPEPGTAPGAAGDEVVARDDDLPTPVSVPGVEPATPALEAVSDRRLAEVLAVIADEWDACDERGRAGLLARFWGLHPDLRERAAARAGRRLARLAGVGGAASGAGRGRLTRPG